MACGLSSTSNFVRRTGNHNPNLWSYDFVHSLKSPYAPDSSYTERAETLISEIKVMLGAAIRDGESTITPSAYDTAWVARVPSIDGSAGPQYPQTVDWILKNQLKDGSWGTQSHFLWSISTRLCTLGKKCVQWEDNLPAQYQEAEWLAVEYVPSLAEYIKNGITSVGKRILLLSRVLTMEGQLLSQEVLEKIDYPGRRVLTELNCFISHLADDTKTYKDEKARGELASSIECYMKDHPGCTEKEALNHIYGILEAAVKELTWEFLKPNDVSFPCKKMIFEETRATMMLYKDRDGFGISKLEMKDHIKECFIEPLAL